MHNKINTRLCFYLFLFFVLFFSCTQEKKEIVNDEIIEAESSSVYENLISEADNLNEEKEENVLIVAEQNKQVEERKEIIKEQLEKSKVVEEFKDDCEAIFNKYSETINRYVETNDETVLDEILHFINDPVFEGCRKNEKFKDKFDALDEKIE